MSHQAVVSWEERRERDHLKKRWQREDGGKCSLERREEQRRREEHEAKRRCQEDAEEEATERRRREDQRRREEQGSGNSQVPQSKYAELLAIIEELGKEIRPTYAGSKSAMERLKRGIIHARGLVRECLAETERNARS
uniref:Cyclin dependent kinase 2 associated protein 1 n=1 Tax=Equus asinus TaxID=9793 RepID=A0A9L0KDB2_EQUAS